MDSGLMDGTCFHLFSRIPTHPTLPNLPVCHSFSMRSTTTSCLFLSVALGAFASPSRPRTRLPRQDDASADDAAAVSKKVLFGGGPTGMVGAADFDRVNFNIVANNTIAGTSASWMLFKDPNLLYAVDENSNNTRLFNASIPMSDTALQIAIITSCTVRPGHQRLEASPECHRLLWRRLPRVQQGPDPHGWSCFRSGPDRRMGRLRR